MIGSVYFLRCGDFVKIGFSANPEKRLRYLQTATPFNFEFLGAHPGTKKHEQHLHKIFASLRYRHEWFCADKSILEVAKNGLPSMNIQTRSFNVLGKYLSHNKITQTAFAEKIGVTQRAVSLWVLGTRTPRPALMRKIIAETNGAVTPNDFLTLDIQTSLDAAQ